MKKNFILISLVVIGALLFSTASVFANASPSVTTKKTPGAQAMLHALNPKTNNGIGNLNAHGKKVENYRGTISAVAPDSLSLTLSDASVVVFQITTDTRVKVPTLGKTATSADLLVDQKAMVRADAAMNALSISIIPGKPTIIHRVGTVTAYTAGASISIVDRNGNPFTFVITPTTKILPADRSAELVVGALVTIICPRDVTGGPLTADGIVIHPATTLGAGAPQVTETPEVTDTPEATATPEVTEIPAL